MSFPVTFDELFEHFKNMYGRNNKIYYTSLAQHTDTLSSRISALRNATRKHFTNKRMQEECVGQIIARIFAVAGFFYKLPLNEFMCKKFPMSGCGYCKKRHCTCTPAQREEHVEQDPESDQLVWSIGDYQRHLKITYGEVNSRFGLDTCFAWLSDELGEITRIANQEDLTNASACEIEKAYAREISDVFAWTLGIATILEIDVETVVMKNYSKGCPHCASMQCNCRRYKIDQGNVVLASSQVAS